MRLGQKLIVEALKGSGRNNNGAKFAQAILSQTNSTSRFRVMSDVALWIHSKMVTNPGGPVGRKIRGLNKIFDVTRNVPASNYIAASALAASFSIWSSQVAPRGPWDYKNHRYPRGIRDSNFWIYDPVSMLFYRRDFWGNVHYGFVGRAIGFARQTLRQGGGAAQLAADTLRFRTDQIYDGFGRLVDDFDGFASFEPPDDLRSVEFGIDLYDQFGTNMNFFDFLKSIRNASQVLPTKK